MIRSLAVFLDARRSSATRLEIAIGLAAGGGQLTAVFVDLPPVASGTDRSAGFARGAGIADVAGHYHEADNAALDAIRERLAKSASHDGLRIEVRRLPVAATLREAVAHCRYVDLAILPPATTRVAADRAMMWSSGDLVVSAGVPCLFVPATWTKPAIGHHAAIAWNASRESRRAVGDALPLLDATSCVTVLLIDPRSGPAAHGEDPGFDIARFLAGHGIRADVERIESRGEPVEDVLLRRAGEIGADLIVAGAYGHSRVVEFVLGSTTRALLERATMPIMLAH